MTLQVLISTMHQTNYSLLDKMNIQTDAVVINQCDNDTVEKIVFKEHCVTWVNTTERGVGRSRNRAILTSNADVLLFADDDVVYEKGYAAKVCRLFEENPGVGIAVFNLQSLNPERPEKLVNKDYKLRWYNCLKFGAFRIAIRRECLLKKNVYFSLLFGGGAPYKAGEDNLFITQCLRSGMRGLASKRTIGTVAQEESTWFTGYDDRYYSDRGALFAAMYGRRAKLMMLLFELRYLDGGIFHRIKQEWRGIEEYIK